MNPKLTRQKGQTLISLVSTLGAHDSVSVLRRGWNHLSSDQNSQHQHAVEKRRKPQRSQKAPHDFLLKGNSLLLVCPNLFRKSNDPSWPRL
jgi:hypothetical protein